MAPRGTTGEPLSLEITDYVRQVAAVQQDVSELVAGLSDDQLRWRPGPGTWSVLECVAHLNETARHYVPAVTAALDRARANGWLRRGPFRYGLLGRWFVGSMEPPAKFKVKRTPFLPDLSASTEGVLSDFHRLHGQVIDQIRSAEGIDLAKTKVPSPASRFLKLSLGNAFELLAAHGRRHVWQARQVIARPGFPGSEPT